MATRFKLTENVLTAEVGDEAVLLSLRDGRYFGLNGVGRDVWTLLSTSRSIDELVAALEHEYDVQPDQLRRDIDIFVKDLVARGLAVAEEGP